MTDQSESERNMSNDSQEIKFNTYIFSNDENPSPKENRSKNWNETETKVLIKSWSNHYNDLINSKRNSQIYRRIAADLRLYNINRNPKEIQAKIKNLSHSYRKERMLRSSGAPPTSWKFFKIINGILGPSLCNNYSLKKDYTTKEKKENTIYIKKEEENNTKLKLPSAERTRLHNSVASESQESDSSSEEEILSTMSDNLDGNSVPSCFPKDQKKNSENKVLTYNTNSPKVKNQERTNDVAILEILTEWKKTNLEIGKIGLKIVGLLQKSNSLHEEQNKLFQEQNNILRMLVEK